SSFDFVVGCELLSYLDLGKTIPEMGRVMNENGEIRLSGSALQIRTNEDIPTLIPGYGFKQKLFRYSIGEKFVPTKGITKMLQWVQEQDLSMYLVATDPSEFRDVYDGS